MNLLRTAPAWLGALSLAVTLFLVALPSAFAASTGSVVVLDASGCGAHWSAPASGAITFTIENKMTSTQDVALVGGSETFAEIPTLGPGVDRPLRVVLEPGRYSWQCVSVDGAFSFSPTLQVDGPRVADPSPGYQPVNPNDLEASALAYRQWAAKGLGTVSVDVGHLVAAVESGDRARAEKDWLTAHLAYERLGAVYDTFGDFNDEINGRADGLVGGVKNPKWSGFLRLEYALWHHQSKAVATKVATKLDHDVHALIKAFPSQLLPVTDVPLRAHEIIENALQFELTADTDEGSHTNLATVRANIAGDREVLSVLAPLMKTRDPKVQQTAEAQLTTFANLVDRYRSPNGHWKPIESLTLAQHQALDASADAALATLDQYPAILEQASGDAS